MRVQQGGTRIHCPNCKGFRICQAVSPSSLGWDSGRRKYNEEHEDIQWFRRGRTCLTCGSEFLTGELAEAFVGELCELREALGQIKASAEQYIAESNKASKALQILNDSLGVLKALKLYQDADTPGATTTAFTDLAATVELDDDNWLDDDFIDAGNL